MRKLLFLLIFFHLSFALSAKVTDRIIAVVNDDIVTLSDLYAFKKEVLANSPDAPELKSDAALLNLLIETRLTQQLIQKLGLEASEEDVNGQINQILKSQNIEKKELESFLKQRGVVFSAYKKNIKANIERQRLLEREIQSSISVPEEDIKGYYYNTYKKGTQKISYHIRQIFFPAKTKEEISEQMKAADKIYQEFKLGASADKLIEKHMKDAGFSDLGFLGEEDLIGSFKSAVKKLRLKDLSPPFTSASGIHLIQLVEAKREGAKSYTEAKDEIFKKLYDERFQKVLSSWIKRKKEEAFIKKLSPIEQK